MPHETWYRISIDQSGDLATNIEAKAFVDVVRAALEAAGWPTDARLLHEPSARGLETYYLSPVAAEQVGAVIARFQATACQKPEGSTLRTVTF